MLRITHVYKEGECVGGAEMLDGAGYFVSNNSDTVRVTQAANWQPVRDFRLAQSEVAHDLARFLSIHTNLFFRMNNRFFVQTPHGKIDAYAFFIWGVNRVVLDEFVSEMETQAGYEPLGNNWPKDVPSEVLNYFCDEMYEWLEAVKLPGYWFGWSGEKVGFWPVEYDIKESVA